MPWVTLWVMTATGSPGIKRGNMKFNRNAQTKVIVNHTNFLKKYCLYPFNVTPPRRDIRYYTNKVTFTLTRVFYGVFFDYFRCAATNNNQKKHPG